ncbi:MAG: hypothetical protein ACYDIA_16165 [Candidatus Humimicrobiaceae bacterium]
MQDSWIVKEAKKIDITKDVVILENPDKKNCLDNILINRFWPVIEESLENTDYDYSPQDTPETDFELSHELTRSLTFMLFDGQRAIFRGKLSCSMTGWMLRSEFFLGLAQDTDSSVIFKILEDPRFRGLPPTLEIYKDMPFDYFHITFENGKGAGWGLYDDSYIYNRISEVIDINARLYDFSKNGYINNGRIVEFLSLAYHIYEAY